MKVGIVQNSEQLPWQSCNALKEILIDDYEREFATTLLDIKKVNKEQLAEYDKVILIDNEPVPVEFVEKYSDLNTEFIFHLFGDVLLRTDEWDKVIKCLENTNTKFVFLTKNIAEIFKNKFIDQNNTYIYSPRIIVNNKTSALIQKDDDKLNFVFAGRLTPEKGVEDLLEVFSDGEIASFAHLHILGKVDHKGSFYKHQQDKKEFLNKIILAKHRSKNISFYGKVAEDEVASFIAKADCFVSFSTYMLEDFGLCAYQAYYLSRPLLLSAWGGHHQYDDIEKVNVIRENRVRIDKNDAILKLKKLRDNRESFISEIKAKDSLKKILSNPGKKLKYKKTLINIDAQNIIDSFI